jgi:hypothetical protein
MAACTTGDDPDKKLGIGGAAVVLASALLCAQLNKPMLAGWLLAAWTSR